MEQAVDGSLYVEKTFFPPTRENPRNDTTMRNKKHHDEARARMSSIFFLLWLASIRVHKLALMVCKDFFMFALVVLL
jgi:hypothetical protein